MQLTGAQIVLECLKEQGVDTVFGYPGGTILNIYDELYKQRDQIRHILTSHEQGASHAADGYARSTGRVGVCFATSGPGSTNLVTGIATAYMDSVPMVAITANVAVPLLGKDTFQEVDIAGIVTPVTKYAHIVKDVNQLADSIRRAFVIAKSGRPGPVLIDITKDVTAERCEFTPMKQKPVRSGEASISEEDLKEVKAMIKRANRPMLFIGGGTVISGAAKEVAALADRIDAPVTSSLMGNGVYPSDGPRYTGMLGMHGTKTSNRALAKCDLLIALGVRFSDRVTGHLPSFAKDAEILQIDIDAAEINKNVKVNKALIGDVKEVLKKILKDLPVKKHRDWMREIVSMKQAMPLVYEPDVLTGPYVIEEIGRITKGDAIITTDVGQHQMWTSQYYPFKHPRTFLTSGGLGTMGYGLGAAIGAKAGNPKKTVINITGDGCFRMNMNELITSVRSDLKVIDVIMDNEVLGMVRQWQNLFYEKRFSATTFGDGMDYIKLAESMGAIGIRVTKTEEVEKAIRMALAADRTVVLDCRIARDDMVYPMAAPGAPIEGAFDQSDLKKKKGKK